MKACKEVAFGSKGTFGQNSNIPLATALKCELAS